MARQGIENGEPAVDLAKQAPLQAHRLRRLHGLFRVRVPYQGPGSPPQEIGRRLGRRSGNRRACEYVWLPVQIVTGGSTGNYNIDKDHGFTELEAGSYVFMDTVYLAIGGKDDDVTYKDFAGSLTVLTTVDSKRHPNLATTDYGNKAMARPTDKVKGMPWVEARNQGAEYGALKWNDGAPS